MHCNACALSCQGLSNPALSGCAPQCGEGEREAHVRYAARVAGGHREEPPPGWPPALRSLLEDCWEADPRQRPSMERVIERLQVGHRRLSVW